MPLVSVVIPTYNREQVVGKTIKSVLNQTIQDYEIIVVDDGSVDNTKKIIEQFKSDKIKYFFQHNQGAQAARNAGLSKATGKYIGFLDSDDWWLPTFLEESIKEFDKDDEVGCVYCWPGIENGNTVETGRKDVLSGWIYADALRQGYIAGTPFMLMKKMCVDVIGGWDTNFVASQDDDICFRLAKKFKFKLIPKVLSVCCVDYDGSQNRISGSGARVATGWWTLWNKFEKDVLELCGRKIMALHLMNCASLFFKAEKYEMGREAYEKAVSYYDSEQELRDDFEYEIKRFVSSGKVYCYGAGDVGEKISVFLRGLGININGFIVSAGKQANSFLAHSLYNWDEVDITDGVIIISTVEKYHGPIEDNIRNRSASIPVFKLNRNFIKYMDAIENIRKYL